MNSAVKQERVPLEGGGFVPRPSLIIPWEFLTMPQARLAWMEALDHQMLSGQAITMTGND